MPKEKKAEFANAGMLYEISEMLLYVRTDESMQPDGIYQMSDNRINVKTFNLNRPFDAIRIQLDSIADAHFLLKEIATLHIAAYL